MCSAAAELIRVFSYIRLSEMGQFGTITAEQQESLFDAIGCICTEDETVGLHHHWLHGIHLTLL